MRLGYFTMPVHPMHRNWTETLKEDREAIILADKLGFASAFVGEHLTDACENVPNSMTFLATLIHATTQIKLATGTSNLSQKHPVLVATQAAMFDHLAEGRFIFGISPGALPTDSEAIGTLELDKNALFAEAIEVILAIWERDPPYEIDFPNNRFKVSTAKTMMKHLGVGFMGKPYLHPLSANFLLSQHLKSHWANYAKGKAEVGQTADTNDWRVARTIFVADDDKVAERYGRTDPNSPYSHYYGQMRGKLARGKRLYVFKSHKEQPDEEVTHDFIM